MQQAGDPCESLVGLVLVAVPLVVRVGLTPVLASVTDAAVELVGKPASHGAVLQLSRRRGADDGAIHLGRVSVDERAIGQAMELDVGADAAVLTQLPVLDRLADAVDEEVLALGADGDESHDGVFRLHVAGKGGVHHTETQARALEGAELSSFEPVVIGVDLVAQSLRDRHDEQTELALGDGVRVGVRENLHHARQGGRVVDAVHLYPLWGANILDVDND